MNDIYTYTVPVFVKQLSGLRNILEKAKAHLAETGGDEQALLADALYPDMFPLAKQVQVACDNAKGATARLSGTENPKMEDNERTIDELVARIDKTIAFVRSVPESAFAGAAERKVTLGYFDGYFTGFDYAREYAIPNFFFHAVTAYGLIRKNGVPVGKADYTNGLPLKKD
jgi:hypothetical protein